MKLMRFQDETLNPNHQWGKGLLRASTRGDAETIRNTRIAWREREWWSRLMRSDHDRRLIRMTKTWSLLPLNLLYQVLMISLSVEAITRLLTVNVSNVMDQGGTAVTTCLAKTAMRFHLWRSSAHQGLLLRTLSFSRILTHQSSNKAELMGQVLHPEL